MSSFWWYVGCALVVLVSVTCIADSIRQRRELDRIERRLAMITHPAGKDIDNG